MCAFASPAYIYITKISIQRSVFLKANCEDWSILQKSSKDMIAEAKWLSFAVTLMCFSTSCMQYCLLTYNPFPPVMRFAICSFPSLITVCPADSALQSPILCSHRQQRVINFHFKCYLNYILVRLIDSFLESRLYTVKVAAVQRFPFYCFIFIPLNSRNKGSRVCFFPIKSIQPARDNCNGSG